MTVNVSTSLRDTECAAEILTDESAAVESDRTYALVAEVRTSALALDFAAMIALLRLVKSFLSNPTSAPTRPLHNIIPTEFPASMSGHSQDPPQNETP